MADDLLQQWNSHAFPDEYSSREEAWTAESEHRAQETRLENYLADSGDGMIIRRHSTGKDSRKQRIEAEQRRLTDMELLAVGSPAYMEAYNNKLTFRIGGEDVDITQGKLHDLAKRHAEDLQRQIDAARRRGASAEELNRLQSERRATVRIERNTDPQRGLMDGERLSAVRNDLRQAPGLVHMMKREGSQRLTVHAARTMDNSEDAPQATLAEAKSSHSRGSVANEIENSPIAALDVTPKRDFKAAVTNTPSSEEQAPATPGQIPGFGLS